MAWVFCLSCFDRTSILKSQCLPVLRSKNHPWTGPNCKQVLGLANGTPGEVNQCKSIHSILIEWHHSKDDQLDSSTLFYFCKVSIISLSTTSNFDQCFEYWGRISTSSSLFFTPGWHWARWALGGKVSFHAEEYKSQRQLTKYQLSSKCDNFIHCSPITQEPCMELPLKKWKDLSESFDEMQGKLTSLSSLKNQIASVYLFMGLNTSSIGKFLHERCCSFSNFLVLSQVGKK